MGVLAVRALLRGEASADQQRVGMSFIANQLCRRFDSPYIPGSTELDADGASNQTRQDEW